MQFQFGERLADFLHPQCGESDLDLVGDLQQQGAVAINSDAAFLPALYSLHFDNLHAVLGGQKTVGSFAALPGEHTDLTG